MISVDQILAFVLALGVAVFIPGPGIITLVARSVSGGKTMGFVALAGLIAGDLVYLSLAVFGLALLTQMFSFLFVVIKFLATGYLCLLAWQFWHAKPQVLEVGRAPNYRDLWSGFATGFLVTLANPKTITFYLALLPLVVDLNSITVSVWAFVLVPLAVLVLLVVGGFYIVAAVTARALLASASSQRLIYRSAAVAMLVAALSMVLKYVD